MHMYPYMAQELIECIANESPQTDIIYTVQVVLYCQYMTVKFSTLTTRNTEVLPTYWFIVQISTNSFTSNCKKGPSRPSIIIIIIVLTFTMTLVPHHAYYAYVSILFSFIMIIVIDIISNIVNFNYKKKDYNRNGACDKCSFGR